MPGSFRICMRSPEGKYREVLEPERLVFTWAWENPKGNPGRETLVTVRLAKHGAKTKLAFRQAVFETVKDRNSHRGGWTEAFDRLAKYLATG